MDAGHGPPPPPPPPPGAGGGGSSTEGMQLPPHLQAMMQEVQATLGGHHQQQNDQQLPIQFGYGGGRGRGGGGGSRVYQQHHENRGFGGRRGGGRGGRGDRGGRSGRGRGGGGRGRGRGGGRGSGRGSHYGNHHSDDFFTAVKRRRDYEGTGAARFFLPSCLEDPWLPLLQPASMASAGASAVSTQSTYGTQLPPDRHQKHHGNNRQHRPYVSQPGRVLFQPSFLEDPWTAFVR